MERRIRTRIGVLTLVIGLLIGLFSLRVYKLQISEDARQADTLTYYTTVQAARGQILDRNGTVLVTNRASYDIVVISYVWLNGPSPNESLMKLLDSWVCPSSTTCPCPRTGPTASPWTSTRVPAGTTTSAPT